MEHINGVWIPIGILGMILLGCIVEVIRTPKATSSPYDTTQQRRTDYASTARAV